MGAEDTPAVATCTLPYPDRFHAAQRFVSLAPPGSKPLPQETQLLLYALGQQATQGPCKEKTSWNWSPVETAKLQAWKRLGSMNSMEAMRLYVRTLDEEQLEWYGVLLKAEQPEATPAAAEASDGAAEQPAQEQQATNGDQAAPAAEPAAEAKAAEAAEPAAPAAPAPPPLADQIPADLTWAPLQLGDQRKPVPRYEQGVGLVDGGLYVLGGNYAGRYLSDVWRLDTASLQWSQLQLQQPPAAADSEGEAAAAGLPALAGHTVSLWEGKLVVLGGHAKAKSGPTTMAVRLIDPATSTITTVDTTGAAPVARGGHTATLVGGKLYVFGGEDSARRSLGDLCALDLATWEWSQPAAGGKAPAARSAHAAAAYQDRYLLVFGGGSVATCFGDLHVLDTKALTWSQPTVASSGGLKVTPRAGHAGAVCGDVWYIVGGGNNVKGCTDMLALDLSQLAVGGPLTWHAAASIALRDPLSSEGIGLVSLEQHKALLAFGGYNGKYQNTVGVFKVPDAFPALQQQQAAAEAAEAAAAPAAASEAAAPEEAKQQQAAAPAEAESAPAQAEANGSSAAAQQQSAAAPATPAVTSPAAKPAAATPAASKPPTDTEIISDLRSQLEAARREAEAAIREAAAAKEGAAHELALLRKQLATAQAQLDTATKGLEEARGALQRESAKVLKLEAEAAETQKKLATAGEAQRELEVLRRQAKEATEAAAASGKKAGGIWGYISGSSS